jgi:hypothetical protein
MTLQEHYYAIKSGKGNKDQFLKQARNLFPEYFTQYTDFDTATNVLKSKQIISEAAGGVVSKGFDIYDWKKILAEEAKAEEKETSKEVKDKQAHAYDNTDMKNADNVNFNEIMKGFYAELKDEKNAEKTGDELKAMVVKNLAKDPLFYTKDGMFGTKGVGYTTEAPGLGQPEEPKGKYKSSGYGDLDTDIKIEKVKSNVQDSLSDKEAKTTNPSKVKEMEVTPKSAYGVKRMPMPGAEKKMKLQEGIHDRDILSRPLSNPHSEYKPTPPEELAKAADFRSEMQLRASYRKEIDDPTISDDELRYILSGKGAPGFGGTPNAIEKIIKDRAGKNMSEGEQKLRSLIRNVIKEALDENVDEVRGGGNYGMMTINPKGGGGGKRFIPTSFILPTMIKNRFKDHIYFEDNKFYISSILYNFLTGLSKDPKSYIATLIRDLNPGLKGVLSKSYNYESGTKDLSGKKLEYKSYHQLKGDIKETDKGLEIPNLNRPSEKITEDLVEQKLRSLIRNVIKEALVNEISPELFKRATDVSRERGQDRRTSSMGEAFFSKFKGKPLMGGTIINIRYVKPQQGNYEEVIVEIEVPSSVVPGETKSRYIYYDVRKDQWDIDKEITRADARVLSLIAQHINPNTRYKSGGEGFQIKGY